MAGKENDDFELNLKDADGGVGSIDALLAADGNDAPAAGGNGNADDDDDFIDFNDFSIDDLDTALSKYEASRGGGNPNRRRRPRQNLQFRRRKWQLTMPGLNRKCRGLTRRRKHCPILTR